MLVQNCVRDIGLCKLFVTAPQAFWTDSFSAPLFRHGKLLAQRTDATLLPTVPPTRLEIVPSGETEAQFAISPDHLLIPSALIPQDRSQHLGEFPQVLRPKLQGH